MRRVIAIIVALISSTAIAETYSDAEADRIIFGEVAKMSATTYRNYCFKLIREQGDRQYALNRFRISPSEACECTTTEATRAMAASPNYRAYARVMVNAIYQSGGQPPRFPHGYEEDAVTVEASRVFDESWGNCFFRLKRD